MTSVLVKHDVDINCPFCGRRFIASENGTVLHYMPMCEKFEQLDPVEFLKACNDEIAKKRLS